MRIAPAFPAPPSYAVGTAHSAHVALFGSLSQAVNALPSGKAATSACSCAMVQAPGIFTGGTHGSAVKGMLAEHVPPLLSSPPDESSPPELLLPPLLLLWWSAFVSML